MRIYIYIYIHIINTRSPIHGHISRCGQQVKQFPRADGWLDRKPGGRLIMRRNVRRVRSACPACRIAYVAVGRSQWLLLLVWVEILVCVCVCMRVFACDTASAYNCLSGMANICKFALGQLIFKLGRVVVDDKGLFRFRSATRTRY